MKKIITIVLAVFCISAANAQLEKGTTFLSGSFNLTGYNKPVGDYTNSDLNVGLSPKFGGFVAKNLLLGGELNLSYDHATYKQNNTSTSQYYYNSATNTFGLGPGLFIRYYAPLTTHFYWLCFRTL